MRYNGSIIVAKRNIGILLWLTACLYLGNIVMCESINLNTVEQLNSILYSDDYDQLKEYERDQLIDYQLGLKSLFLVPLDYIEKQKNTSFRDESLLNVKAFPEVLAYYQNKDKEINQEITKLSKMVDSILEAIGDKNRASYECKDLRFSQISLSHRTSFDIPFRERYRTLSFSNKICRVVDYLYNNSSATVYDENKNLYTTNLVKLDDQISNLTIEDITKINIDQKEIWSSYQNLYLEIIQMGYLRRSLFAYPPKQLLDEYYHSRQSLIFKGNKYWHLEFLEFIENSI